MRDRPLAIDLRGPADGGLTTIRAGAGFGSAPVLPAAMESAAVTRTAAVEGTSRTASRRLFERGVRLFEAGEWEAAAEAFAAAYEVVPVADLLWNVAEAYRRLFGEDRADKTCRRALGYYRRYLATAAEVYVDQAAAAVIRLGKVCP